MAFGQEIRRDCEGKCCGVENAILVFIGFALDTVLNWDAEEGCILVPEDTGEKEVCGRLSADTEGCDLTGNGWVYE